MVKRYQAKGGLSESIRGGVVLIDDYASLQAALREALDGWEESEAWLGRHADEKSLSRIAELRKFLDDK